MDENAMEYVAQKLKEIEEFIQKSDACYDDVYEHVEKKLDELRAYAEEHAVPFVADADELISQHREESSSYEESSSSYYEEEDSFYEEEDEEVDSDQQDLDEE